jgi:transcriptional regulator with PAS, ATPase and Fis domain
MTMADKSETFAGSNPILLPVATDETLSLEEPGTAPAPRLRSQLILVVECARPTVGGARWNLYGLDRVAIGRGPVRTARRGLSLRLRSLEIELPDGQVSRAHAEIERCGRDWVAVDVGSKNGTLVNGARVQRHVLADGDVVTIGGSYFLYRQALVDHEQTDDLDHEQIDRLAPLSTLSVELEARFAEAVRIAAANIPVLVRGESGTGKEVAAREIHRRSGRRGAFVALNCGAIAESLIESELFGYRRGAFSGAETDKTGLVQQAAGGTLFLDEVAELSESGQVTLLRVLQEREILPVGGTRPIAVDFRVIAATHQDLEKRVANGTFRQDLYARLAGYTVDLPPLRDRREDLGSLIAALLRRIAPDRADQLRLAPPVAEALLSYSFPLNIRELEQALLAATALADDDRLIARHLPQHMTSSADGGEAEQLSTRDRAIKKRMVELLEETGGNVAATGRAMGKAPVQIRRWCRRFDVDLDAFRR